MAAFGYYLRDRWQVSRNLTLTLGLRYNSTDHAPAPTAASATNSTIAVVRDERRPTVDSASLIARPAGAFVPLPSGRNEQASSSRRASLAYPSATTWSSAAYGLTYDPMPFGPPLARLLTGDPSRIASPRAGRRSDLHPGASTPTCPATARSASWSAYGVRRPMTWPGPPAGTSIRSRQGPLHRCVQSWNLIVERKLIGRHQGRGRLRRHRHQNQFADVRPTPRGARSGRARTHRSAAR